MSRRLQLSPIRPYLLLATEAYDESSTGTGEVVEGRRIDRKRDQIRAIQLTSMQINAEDLHCSRPSYPTTASCWLDPPGMTRCCKSLQRATIHRHGAVLPQDAFRTATTSPLHTAGGSHLAVGSEPAPCTPAPCTHHHVAQLLRRHPPIGCLSNLLASAVSAVCCPCLRALPYTTASRSVQFGDHLR